MRRAVLVFLGALAGCVDTPDNFRLRIAQTVFTQPMAPACGTTLTRVPPDELFVLTAEHCLDCKEVGWLLRERRRQLAGTAVTTWGGVRASDTSDVCAYLRHEQVNLPVVLLPRNALEAAGDVRQLLYLSFDRSGVATVLRGSDARTLLDALAKVRKGGPDPASQ